MAANPQKKTGHYSEAQKKKIMAKVEKFAKTMNIQDAVKKAGVTYGSYRAWSGKPTKRKSAIESLMIPLDKDSPLVILVGKPGDVNNALQQLTSVLKG